VHATGDGGDALTHVAVTAGVFGTNCSIFSAVAWVCAKLAPSGNHKSTRISSRRRYGKNCFFKLPIPTTQHEQGNGGNDHAICSCDARRSLPSEGVCRTVSQTIMVLTRLFLQIKRCQCKA
jgi:hypothetical protein